MTEDHLTWLLSYAAIELSLVALFLGWKRARTVACVGLDAHSVRGSRRGRRALVAAAWVASLVLWFLAVDPGDRGGVSFAFALSVSAVASVVWILSPTDADRDLGSKGVRSGWDAVPFERFGEWRLSGEHLRFRVDGRLWDAAPVRPNGVDALRDRLCELVPERESRYAE